MSGAQASNGFATRAGALLHPTSSRNDHANTASPKQRPQSGTSTFTAGETSVAGRTKSNSVTSSNTATASSKAEDERDRRRAVRTLPPWVQSVTEDDDDLLPSSSLLPKYPQNLHPAAHHFAPQPKPNAVAGRHFDHARSNAPPTLSAPILASGSKWREFTEPTSHLGRGSDEGEIVDSSWLDAHMGDLEKPWEPEDDDDRHRQEEPGFWLFKHSKRRRRLIKIQRTIMNHPLVPLGVRTIIIIFSTLALALSGSIFYKTSRNDCARGSSTWMALIVDVVAIVYTFYITYDEYTSKPLGLRSHRAKMRLIFLDLLFIVFDSANLSVAFEALTDEQWACRDGAGPNANLQLGTCPLNPPICNRQKALTATLLIALIAWLLTFAISTLRLVEKVAGPSDDEMR